MEKKLLILLIFMVFLSPIFGVILAEKVGYHEPLDIAASLLGLKEHDIVNYHTPFEDYSFPGLGPVAGYIASGLLGVAIILAIGVITSKLVKSR